MHTVPDVSMYMIVSCNFATFYSIMKGLVDIATYLSLITAHIS